MWLSGPTSWRRNDTNSVRSVLLLVLSMWVEHQVQGSLWLWETRLGTGSSVHWPWCGCQQKAEVEDLF